MICITIWLIPPSITMYWVALPYLYHTIPWLWPWMSEEAGHIVLLIAKYHAEAVGHFLFSKFYQRFRLFWKPFLWEVQKRPYIQNLLTYEYMDPWNALEYDRKSIYRGLLDVHIIYSMVLLQLDYIIIYHISIDSFVCWQLSQLLTSFQVASLILVY